MVTFLQSIQSIRTDFLKSLYTSNDQKRQAERYRCFMLSSELPLVHDPKTEKAFTRVPDSIETNPEFKRCPLGLVAWDDIAPRTLYVKVDIKNHTVCNEDLDARCQQATQQFVLAVANLAPFTSEEKKSMPFGHTTYVRTDQGYCTLERLRGRSSYRACGFGATENGQGILESTNWNPPCEDMGAFRDAFQAAAQRQPNL